MCKGVLHGWALRNMFHMLGDEGIDYIGFISAHHHSSVLTCYAGKEHGHASKSLPPLSDVEQIWDVISALQVLCSRQKRFHSRQWCNHVRLHPADYSTVGKFMLERIPVRDKEYQLYSKQIRIEWELVQSVPSGVYCSSKLLKRCHTQIPMFREDKELRMMTCWLGCVQEQLHKWCHTFFFLQALTKVVSYLDQCHQFLNSSVIKYITQLFDL